MSDAELIYAVQERQLRAWDTRTPGTHRIFIVGDRLDDGHRVVRYRDGATETVTDVDIESSSQQIGQLPKQRRSSVAVPAGILLDAEIPVSVKNLWSVMGLYADDDGRITIKLDDIAAISLTFLTRRNAERTMRDMERFGIVDVERGASRRIPNTYVLRTERREAVESK